MKYWVITTLNKPLPEKMAKSRKWSWYIKYYAVGNTNTQRQEKELAAIIQKRNYAGSKLISTSIAIDNWHMWQFSNIPFSSPTEKKFMA